jgi:hypothetical protein
MRRSLARQGGSEDLHKSSNVKDSYADGVVGFSGGLGTWEWSGDARGDPREATGTTVRFEGCSGCLVWKGCWDRGVMQRVWQLGSQKPIEWDEKAIKVLEEVK